MDIFFLIVFFLGILILNFSFVLSTNIALFGCIFSLSFFVFLLITKKIKKLPLYAFIALFIILLTFLLNLFINPVDKLRGYEDLFLWSSYVFLFAISSQVRIPEKKMFLSTLIFILFCIVLYLSKSFFPSLLPFIKASDRQFILPSTGMHNHLGDIVGLGLISILLVTSSSHVASIARLILLPLVVISFTKSALLSLLIVLVLAGIGVKEKRGNLLYTAFVLFYVSLAAVVIFSQEFSSLPFVTPIQKYMQAGFNLAPKPLLSQRDTYASQVNTFLRNSSIEQVGFGLGLGNFSYAASKTTSEAHLIIADPHNIFLTYLVEGGIISLLWTAAFFVLICYYGIKYKRKVLFLFLYLLFLFQTDYLYQIPAIMFLFFFLSGQLAQNSNENEQRPLLVDMGMWASLFIFIMFVGIKSYAIKTEYARQQEALTRAMELNKTSDIDRAADILYSTTPYDETLLVRLSSIYEAQDQKNKALYFLERLLVFQPHVYVENFEHILKLKEDTKQDVPQYIQKVLPELQKASLLNPEKEMINKECGKYASSLCFK